MTCPLCLRRPGVEAASLRQHILEHAGKEFAAAGGKAAAAGMTRTQRRARALKAARARWGPTREVRQ